VIAAEGSSMNAKAMRHGLGAAAVVGLAVLLPACQQNTTPNVGQKRTGLVRGKVTFKGEPVPYGAVLLYNFEDSRDKQSGAYVPSAFGMIGPDGQYEVQGAPEGKAMVVVACDPDLDGPALTQPKHMGPPAGGGMPQGGGFPQAGGPAMAGGAPPMGGPPVAGGLPQGGLPQFGGPPMAGGPPQGGGGPPMADGPPDMGPPKDTLPKDMPKVPKMVNPATKELSEAKKNTLKEVHDRYGSFGKGGIILDVKEGEQTFDVRLQ
jgi:hypothetical protein